MSATDPSSISQHTPAPTETSTMPEHQHQQEPHVALAPPPAAAPTGWSLAAVATLVGLLGILTGGTSSYAVLGRRVDVLEASLKDHVSESKEGRKDAEASVRSLADQVVTLKSEHGTRLSVVEERLTAIQSTLARIDSKLDDLATQGRRR